MTVPEAVAAMGEAMVAREAVIFDPPAGADPVAFEPGHDTVSIDGLIVRFTDYYSPAGRHEPNWIMWCNHPHHAKKCSKRRGAVPQYERHHGIIEPLAFLHCWHAMPWPTEEGKKTHALENPSQEAVDAFVAAHEEELIDVCARSGR